MSTIRVRKRVNPFVQIDLTPVNDTRISWRAKGLLLYLLSKPDGWRINVKDLVNHAKDGRDAVYTIINELIAAGYIIRERERNDDGTLKPFEYEICEIPLHMDPVVMPEKKSRKGSSDPLPENPDMDKITESEPLPDNPDLDKPDLDKPDLDKPDYSNNESSNNESSNKKIEEEEEEPTLSLDMPPAFFRYKSVVQKMIEKQGTGMLSFKDEDFLGCCVKYEIDPISAELLFDSLGDKIGKYNHKAIKSTFQKYAGLKDQPGRILHPINWFKKTLESEHMLNS